MQTQRTMNRSENSRMCARRNFGDWRKLLLGCSMVAAMFCYIFIRSSCSPEDGMGHDYPPPVWKEWVAIWSEFAHAAVAGP